MKFFEFLVLVGLFFCLFYVLQNFILFHYRQKVKHLENCAKKRYLSNEKCKVDNSAVQMEQFHSIKVTKSMPDGQLVSSVVMVDGVGDIQPIGFGAKKSVSIVEPNDIELNGYVNGGALLDHNDTDTVAELINLE